MKEESGLGQKGSMEDYMPEGQPNASTQYENWKEFPKSCREPTHEEWLAEVNVLKSCRDHWKNSYYATHKIIGKILDFYSFLLCFLIK